MKFFVICPILSQYFIFQYHLIIWHIGVWLQRTYMIVFQFSTDLTHNCFFWAELMQKFDNLFWFSDCSCRHLVCGPRSNTFPKCSYATWGRMDISKFMHLFADMHWALSDEQIISQQTCSSQHSYSSTAKINLKQWRKVAVINAEMLLITMLWSLPLSIICILPQSNLQAQYDLSNMTVSVVVDKKNHACLWWSICSLTFS